MKWVLQRKNTQSGFPVKKWWKILRLFIENFQKSNLQINGLSAVSEDFQEGIQSLDATQIKKRVGSLWI